VPNSGPEELFPDFDRQEQERLFFILENTTPLQRVQWLEDTLLLLAPYLKDRSLPEDHPRNRKSA
jgi:hypothetical protein